MPLSQPGKQRPVACSSFMARVSFECSKRPLVLPPKRKTTQTAEGPNRQAEEALSHHAQRHLHTHLQVVTETGPPELEVIVNPKLSHQPFVLVLACQDQHQVSGHDLENQHRHIITSLPFPQGREYLVNDPLHRQRSPARLRQPRHLFHDPFL